MAWSEVFEVPYSKRPYEFHLHGLSDFQIGNESTSLTTIKTRIQEIVEDPFDSGIVIAGDIEDEDRPSTRTMRRAAFAERPEVAFRDAEKHRAWLDRDVIPLLLPLQKTKYGIMGILAGHHWTILSPALNSVEYICQELTRLSGKKVNYLGEMSAFLDLRFKDSAGSHRIKQIVHVQHGEGGGQTKSAALNKLDRTSQGFIADAYIRAHDCSLVASKSQQLYPKEVKLGGEPEMLSRDVALLNLGAATKGYEMNKHKISYVEAAMMRPAALGWGKVKFIVRRSRKWEDQAQNTRVDLRVEI